MKHKISTGHNILTIVYTVVAIFGCTFALLAMAASKNNAARIERNTKVLEENQLLLKANSELYNRILRNPLP